MIKVLQGDIVTRRIVLDLELAPDLPRVLGDRVQLQQVILNLLMNAFEALENAAIKRVILRTDADDATVRVSVIDHGVGLTDEQLPRMFEPFYTTKADGMGLGLAICQTIMNAHDGTRRRAEERRARNDVFVQPSCPTVGRDRRSGRDWRSGAAVTARRWTENDGEREIARSLGPEQRRRVGARRGAGGNERRETGDEEHQEPGGTKHERVRGNRADEHRLQPAAGGYGEH